MMFSPFPLFEYAMGFAWLVTIQRQFYAHVTVTDWGEIKIQICLVVLLHRATSSPVMDTNADDIKTSNHTTKVKIRKPYTPTCTKVIPIRAANDGSVVTNSQLARWNVLSLNKIPSRQPNDGLT